MTWFRVDRPIELQGRQFNVGAVMNVYEHSKIMPDFFRAIENRFLHVMNIKEIHGEINRQCNLCAYSNDIHGCMQVNCICKRGVMWQ